MRVYRHTKGMAHMMVRGGLAELTLAFHLVLEAGSAVPVAELITPVSWPKSF